MPRYDMLGSEIMIHDQLGLISGFTGGETIVGIPDSYVRR